ncbi:LPS-assembly protein LptD [Amaricoccus macauensis]|uniref:LPS-assembly protein LptD n=1 Tax=Amaricoccus macauensis TaxID=57001 RepID=UPI003C7AF11D
MSSRICNWKALSTLAAATVGVLWAGSLQSQPASLIADSVTYDEKTGLLTATGDVEAVYGTRVLHAQTLVYDEKAEEIRATGPISVTDIDGTIFLADAAQLSPDFSAGLIQGGRLLIADQLQLAASEIERTGSRYTALQRTIASSCVICAENPVPTWSIRAKRVTLDEQEERIYFEGARFEVLGAPIAYLPAMSIPDPRISRSSGFLLPSYHQSDLFGSGVKLPYYLTLGPSADITVTPFVTTDGATLFEGEYRREFRNGGIDLGGTLALDDGSGDSGRGAVDASGEFRLPRGFTSEFQLEFASDKSFLQEFDYSDDDRLTSYLQVDRVRSYDYLHLGTVGFQSLREDEDDGSVPFILPEYEYNYRGAMPGAIGGLFGLNANALGITREEGRDVLRAGGGADWQQRWIFGNGLVTNATLAGDFDIYGVGSDPDGDDGGKFRAVPIASTEVSYPLQRNSARATHVIEPIAQLVWSEDLGSSNVPNEDSQLPELDETNLFALNRYPGRDRVETGLRANLGLRYNRYDADGWSLGATMGRVVRATDDNEFPEGSGLAGKWSDYVGAVSVRFQTGFEVTNRALFDGELNFRRNEFALSYEDDRTELETSYTYFAEDSTNEILGPQPEINELGIEASYRFLPNWGLELLWRYDVVTEQNLKAGGALVYGNECAEFELSISRRFTSSVNLDPSTSIQFDVKLAGLGDGESQDWPSRDCRLKGA